MLRTFGRQWLTYARRADVDELANAVSGVIERALDGGKKRGDR